MILGSRRAHGTSGSAGVKDSSKSAAMADDDAPYSPGSGYPGTGTESREHTPYSPAGNLAIILGGDDRDSAQGWLLIRIK